MIEHLFKTQVALRDQSMLVKHGAHALFLTVHQENEGIVVDLLARGVSVNGSIGRDMTALVAAVAADSLKILRFLLDRGADANVVHTSVQSTTGFAEGLLSTAVYAGAMEGAHELLRMESRPQYFDQALHEAAKRGDVDFASLLLDIALPSTPRALAVSISRTRCPLMLDLLLSRCGELVDFAALNNYFPYACRTYGADIVSVLIAYGVDINIDNAWEQYPPLLGALILNNESGVEVAKVLIENGVETILPMRFLYGRTLLSRVEANLRDRTRASQREDYEAGRDLLISHGILQKRQSKNKEPKEPPTRRASRPASSPTESLHTIRVQIDTRHVTDAPEMTAMPLLPPDYHREIARELVEFFHTFYRFGSSASTFNLDDPAYQSLLHNLLFASLAVGALVFILLAVVVVRRTILHIRSAYARRVSMEAQTMEISAVILLTVLAISSLSGLLGEAQVDYSAGVVRGAMTNTSHLFTSSQHLVRDTLNASSDVSFRADSMVVSFNKSDLPEQAFKLSIEALRLTHAAKDFVNATSVLLPTNYEELARDWEFSYFMLKSTTNFAILAVSLASFLSISSIGWSMVSPLRLSIFVILSVVPISHTLIGVYLSSTILTADFCAAPMNSTMTLLHTTPVVNYYVECPANTTNPFASYASSVQESALFVAQLQKELEDYASHHGDVGKRMKTEFLDPIGSEITQLEGFLGSFNQTQHCETVAAGIAHAIDAYCEFGIVGFFSMWVHQMIICLVLFVSVITSVLVYERVHIREVRSDLRYQLLSTYEDDDVEHVYLSSD